MKKVFLIAIFATLLSACKNTTEKVSDDAVVVDTAAVAVDTTVVEAVK